MHNFYSSKFCERLSNLKPCLHFVTEKTLRKSSWGSGVPAYWHIQWVDENTRWSPWSISFSHPEWHVVSLMKWRQGWRLIHRDLISSKPISYSCVRQVPAKFRKLKIVHSGTAKKLLQTSEMKFIQSFQSWKKHSCRKNPSSPHPRKNIMIHT